MTVKTLYYSIIETPIGNMKLIGDDYFLYALECVGDRADKVEKKLQKYGYTFAPGGSKIIEQAKKELALYFQGELQLFSIPLFAFGTDFQKKVWQELAKIPLKETISYRELARRVGNERAFRAVANANGKNNFTIIVPCHRVINQNGNLGGYSAGIDRKKWLLDFEK